MKKRPTLPAPLLAKWRVHFFERHPTDDPKGTVPGRQFLVESMIRFAAEQGMLPRSLAVDELFAENTRET